jgi:energy-converting hydrogenase Eha subunit B
MIRKPPAEWQRGESAPVRAIRTLVDAASCGTRVARRGGHLARGLFCFFFAIIWGFAALAGGLFAGSLPTFIGVGAMAALMAWGGRRAFAKARETSG